MEPAGHVQVKPPTSFWQVAISSQSSVDVAHSSMSRHWVSPVPAYPEGHALQAYEPGTLVHVESESQPPLLVRHSSTSMQPVVPWPV